MQNCIASLLEGIRRGASGSTASPSRLSSERKEEAPSTVPAAMAAKDPRSRLPQSSTSGTQIRA